MDVVPLLDVGHALCNLHPKQTPYSSDLTQPKLLPASLGLRLPFLWSSRLVRRGLLENSRAPGKHFEMFSRKKATRLFLQDFYIYTHPSMLMKSLHPHSSFSGQTSFMPHSAVSLRFSSSPSLGRKNSSTHSSHTQCPVSARHVTQTGAEPGKALAGSR